MRKESDILVKAGLIIENPVSATGSYDVLVLENNEVKTVASVGSFSNGLTTTSGVTRLGGTLTQNTSITAGTYTFSITSSITSSTAFAVTANSTNSSAITGTATSGIGVSGSGNIGIYGSSSNIGVWGFTTAGTGVQAGATSGVALSASVSPSSTNTVVNVANIARDSSGTAANGIGGALAFFVKNATGVTQQTNRLISKFTDVAGTSQFIITGVNSNVESDVFTLSGNGSVKLNSYGTGSKTGTAVYYLCVDSSGNVIEQSI